MTGNRYKLQFINLQVTIMKKSIIAIYFISIFFTNLLCQTVFESDTIQTTSGDLQMTFIGHGTLMFKFNDLIIHIDPVSRYADYSQLPKADLILITHHHGDHFDVNTINQIRQKKTQIILFGIN